MLIAVFDMIALVSSTILYFRTRHIYKTEYAESHQYDESVLHSHSPARSSQRENALATSDVETDNDTSDPKYSSHQILQVQHESRI